MMLPLRLTNGLATDPNRRALVTGAVLCLAFLAIYVGSPIRTSLDSWWSIPTAMSFIHGQGGELSAYVPRPPDRVPASYALTTIGGHTYSIYPIGTSLLAVPAVALASWIDPAFADVVKTAPDRFEKTVASFYGAVEPARCFSDCCLRASMIVELRSRRHSSSVWARRCGPSLRVRSGSMGHWCSCSLSQCICWS